MSTDKQKTATQRIEELEMATLSLHQTIDTMARDLMTIKEAIKLLGSKLDAVVGAASSGQEINDENISSRMIEANRQELADKTQNLVNQGVLAVSEIAAEDSFVVGQEVEADGKVINPRIQFAVQSLKPELKDKIVGSKAGDTVSLEEGKLNLLVTEVYSIQAPPQQAPEQTA